MGLVGKAMPEATRSARLKRWTETFIACNRHPDRRCSRTQYVRRRKRVCATCNASGGAAARIRGSTSEQKRWSARGWRLARKIEREKV